MPSKKKKYNARFPAGRIKKIMQTDEEVGKVAQAVPVIISRTLELFVESLLTKSMHITLSRNAKTLTPSHMKQCILSESRFDFLKDLVKDIPDASIQEDNENNAIEAIDYSTSRSVEEEEPEDKPEITANFYMEQGTSTVRTPVIQFSPKLGNPTSRSNEESLVPAVRPVPSLIPMDPPKLNFSIESLVDQEPKMQPPIPDLVPTPTKMFTPSLITPPLNPISQNNSNTSDNLYIDEDYDN